MSEIYCPIHGYIGLIQGDRNDCPNGCPKCNGEKVRRQRSVY